MSDPVRVAEEKEILVIGQRADSSAGVLGVQKEKMALSVFQRTTFSWRNEKSSEEMNEEMSTRTKYQLAWLIALQDGTTGIRKLSTVGTVIPTQ